MKKILIAAVVGLNALQGFAAPVQMEVSNSDLQNSAWKGAFYSGASSAINSILPGFKLTEKDEEGKTKEGDFNKLMITSLNAIVGAGLRVLVDSCTIPQKFSSYKKTINANKAGVVGGLSNAIVVGVKELISTGEFKSIPALFAQGYLRSVGVWAIVHSSDICPPKDDNGRKDSSVQTQKS